MRFVKARWFTPGPRTRGDIRLVVVHTMETGESRDVAENVARFFATTAVKASAHYCIDNDSIVKTVRVADVAWAAPGVNHDGIHLEHAGRASQGSRGWKDKYSAAMLARSARLSARLSIAYNIPVRHLAVDELRAGKRGFIGHVDATHAYGPSGGHTDPGSSFPWDRYLAMVRAEVASLTDEPTPSTPRVPPKPKPVKVPATLERGIKGRTVRKLQKALKKRPAGRGLKVDGKFGPATEEAVRTFQRNHHLEVDGVVGPKTWRVLL